MARKPVGTLEEYNLERKQHRGFLTPAEVCADLQGAMADQEITTGLLIATLKEGLYATKHSPTGEEIPDRRERRETVNDLIGYMGYTKRTILDANISGGLEEIRSYTIDDLRAALQANREETEEPACPPRREIPHIDK
jgi:hypothetical protein